MTVGIPTKIEGERPDTKQSKNTPPSFRFLRLGNHTTPRTPNWNWTATCNLFLPSIESSLPENIGYVAAASAVERGGLKKRVRGVVLLDFALWRPREICALDRGRPLGVLRQRLSQLDADTKRQARGYSHRP